MAETSPDAIVIHCDGIIVSVNEAAVELLGARRPEQLTGKPVLDFVHPDFRDLIQQRIQTVVEGREQTHLQEQKLVRLDGSVVDVEASTVPLTYQGRPAAQVVAHNIAQRKEVQEALRQSEERFRSLVQNSSDVITIIQADGTLTYESPSIERVLGYQPQDLVGKNVFQFVHPEDASQIASIFAQGVQRPGVSLTAEFRFRHANGSWRYLESIGQNRLDDPSIRGVVVNSRDVTERKRAEQLRDAAYRISQAADRAENLSDLYRSVHDTIGTVMRTKNFYIALFDPRAGLLSFPYFCDEFDVMPSSKPLGKGLTEYVLRTARPLLCDEAMDRELLQHGEVEVIGTPSQVWLGVPLIIGDRALGVMVVQDYSDPKAFGQRELEMLEYVSSQVAKAIEKKRTEEALRVSESRYRILAENVTDVIWMLDMNLRFVDVSPSIIRLSGYAADQLRTRPLEEFVTPASFYTLKQTMTEVVGPESLKTIREDPFWSRTLELEHLRRDGSTFWAEVKASVLLDQDGRPTGFLGITRDITERKRTEDQLLNLSFTDDLTGLYNRRGFLALAEHQWKLSKRLNRKMMILFADIDGLKRINDSQGHPEGDLALVETAGLLRGIIRESDLVARVGGDEFVVLTLGELNESPDPILARLQKKLESRNARKDLRFHLAISVGVSCSDPEHPCSVEDLMAQADSLMYEEKHRKRGS